ncbi:unnamed protein product [Meganyctiphanes norvegica]|uniref:DUF7027 domain-containing protein n=1 Tax=Meganyctiphanes norvegica TaxID=48144 RepID=A0AAV2S4N5_MEGNR
MRRCCCCISLQKGVVIIAVTSMILGTLLTVGYGVIAGTFEEQVSACRGSGAGGSGGPRDLLALLPTCHVLQDASSLLAMRIFMYIQAAVWLLFLVFSSVLLIGATKGRRGLLIPWLVVVFMLLCVLGYSGVQAALNGRTVDLLAVVLATATLAYCANIVRSYWRLLKHSISRNLCDIADSPQPRSCCSYHNHHLDYEHHHHQGTIKDHPPAYTMVQPLGPPPPIPSKPRPPPSGLGIKI